MYSHKQIPPYLAALPQGISVRIIFIKESPNLHRLENTESTADSTAYSIKVMEIKRPMSNPNSLPFSNGSIFVDSSIDAQTERAFIEVSGPMDDFISLEEFALGSDWEDVLAARWGIPCATQPEKSHAFVGLKASGLRWVRSILQSVRLKKSEVA